LKNKNYFVTFHQCDDIYNPFLNLLKDNGFIRSLYYYGENNLFICPLQHKQLLNDTKNNYNINKYQKAFRFLNSQYLFQKNILYYYYLSMKKKFFHDFDYMPETFNFPEDKEQINNKFENYLLNISDLWLIKPSNLSSGKNITIFKSLKEIYLKSFVITKYITKIHLINGKKYDLRLYILITGLKPLRIYFYKEGLVRIATKNYSLNIDSINDKFVHITNTKINYENKNYKSAIDFNDEEANLWSISLYKKFLKRQNIIWDDIREKIKDIIIKSIACVYKNLLEEIEKQKLSDQSFYNLLGFDILINDNYTPQLIEINKNPSMEISNIINNKIKTKLFIDTLNLIGIIPYSRKTTKPIHYQNDYQKNDYIGNSLCELERPRGDYELIFPLKENIDKYKKFFINITKENNKFWDKIKSEY